MHTLLKTFLTSVIILGIISCSSISVSSDYDPNADFSKYNTYAWGEKLNPNDALQKNQLIEQRVFNAIDTSMMKKGFKKTKNDPQLLVYPHAGTQERASINSWGYGYGGWWGAGPYGGGGIDVDYYTQGTLYIDIIDKKKNQLVWRGVGTGVLGDPSTPQEITANVNDAVSQILASFPPSDKK